MSMKLVDTESAEKHEKALALPKFNLTTGKDRSLFQIARDLQIGTDLDTDIHSVLKDFSDKDTRLSSHVTPIPVLPTILAADAMVQFIYDEFSFQPATLRELLSFALEYNEQIPQLNIQGKILALGDWTHDDESFFVVPFIEFNAQGAKFGLTYLDVFKKERPLWILASPKTLVGSDFGRRTSLYSLRK